MPSDPPTKPPQKPGTDPVKEAPELPVDQDAQEEAGKVREESGGYD